MSYAHSFQRTKLFAKKGENFLSFLQTFSRNFAKVNEAKFLENEKYENIFAKCENFVKTMTTINCSEELVEFSALIAQYLKFYYKYK